jgi:hypothetical protein
VVYKYEQAAKQSVEKLHRTSAP